MSLTTMTDGQLLQAFLKNRDEKAFEEVVKRHSDMVMGVCRRILRHSTDADDAFQKSFLVLVRKAASLVTYPSIGGWLYQVAVRTALDVRKIGVSHERKNTAMQDMIPNVSPDDKEALWTEMRPMLDEELSQLAERYRAPLIMCYMEGQSPEQAADKLGLNDSTFRSRLMRGRDLLKDRLTRRGVTLTSAVLAVCLSEIKVQASGITSSLLIQSTVQAATTTLPTLSKGGLAYFLHFLTAKTILITSGLAISAAVVVTMVHSPSPSQTRDVSASDSSSLLYTTNLNLEILPGKSALVPFEFSEAGTSVIGDIQIQTVAQGAAVPLLAVSMVSPTGMEQHIYTYPGEGGYNPDLKPHQATVNFSRTAEINACSAKFKEFRSFTQDFEQTVTPCNSNIFSAFSGTPAKGTWALSFKNLTGEFNGSPQTHPVILESFTVQMERKSTLKN